MKPLRIIALVVMALLFLPHIALAQDQFPNVPDNTVSVVQLWMIAFGIIVTVVSSVMRWLPNDLPDIAKRLIVVAFSLILAAIGLAVQNNLVPETLLRAGLAIVIVASGIYALLWKPIQDQIAGVKTIAVKEDAPSVIVDPGH